MLLFRLRRQKSQNWSPEQGAYRKLLRRPAMLPPILLKMRRDMVGHLQGVTTMSLSSSAAVRPIIRRTRGDGHGPITRLMSPSDLGQVLKPFVFLDLFDADRDTVQAMADNRIERCVNRLKYFCRFATRYGRTTMHSTGFIRIVSAMIWMV